MGLDPAWIALIGTLFGGIGLKLLEHFLGKNRVKIDEATKMRGELRDEITAQREEIKQLEAEVDKWKLEYFALRDKHSELNTQYTIALAKIKEEAASKPVRKSS
jgi:chromosome segregation ATPase